MKRTMEHRGTVLEYEFTPKQVKNINLRVRGDGTLAVSAPRWVSPARVEDFLRLRWDWLMAARQKTAAPAAQPFGWQPGQSFDLLGQPVVVEHCPTRQRPTASLQGNVLQLWLHDPAQAAAVGTAWYDDFCRRQLALLEERVWPRFQPLGVPRPQLRLRWMTSRWGSCLTQKRVITLNKRLFSFPPAVAEYVLLHEYCHLLHPNHQAGFYALLDDLVPDRKQLDKQLKSGQFRTLK